MTVAPSPQTDPTARVQQAAALAAERVAGVHQLGTSGGRALVRAMGRVPGGRTTYGPGVSVEVGQGKAAVDLSLVVEYGTPVPVLAREVRSEVRSQVERDAGLEVVEVNVTVVGLHDPDDDVEPPEPSPDPEPDLATRDEADVRDADEAVRRIVAQAVEDVARQEGPADKSDGSTAPNTGRSADPVVVVAGATADPAGPDVIVADEVVLADEVVVVADEQDEQDEQDGHRQG